MSLPTNISTEGVRGLAGFSLGGGYSHVPAQEVKTIYVNVKNSLTEYLRTLPARVSSASGH